MVAAYALEIRFLRSFTSCETIRPFSVAANVSRHELWVGGEFGVNVFDTTTGRLKQTLKLPQSKLANGANGANGFGGYVALDARTSDVFVLDGQGCFHVYSEQGSVRKFVPKVPKPGASSSGAAIQSGQLFVSNGSEVCVLNPYGTLLRQYTRLIDHYRFAVAPNGELFLSEPKTKVVAVVDSNGDILRVLGFGLLRCPSSIAFDRSGNVLVCDEKQYCVFALDPLHGQLVYKLDSFSPSAQMDTGNGVGAYARGICVDSDGDIYVSEWFDNRVSVFGF